MWITRWIRCGDGVYTLGIMKKLLVSMLLVGAIFSPVLVFGAVGQISFTSEVQSVDIGMVSDRMTVQAQDSSGVSFNISETGDLYLTSTSGTGEFSSNSTNWTAVEKLTVSKGSANRNFYYKDSTKGVHTITARLVLREGGDEWSTSHKIAVGTSMSDNSETSDSTNDSATEDEESDDTDTSASGTESTTTSETDSTPTPKQSGISAHSSPVYLSTPIAEMEEFSVFAGRDRLAVEDGEILFEAKARIGKNELRDIVSYEWSFGDGKTAMGKMARQNYRLSGAYPVVLNAEYGGRKAASRLMVEVVPARLHLINQNDEKSPIIAIIKNEGKKEVNIGGWIVKNGDALHAFPKDTIILPAGRIGVLEEDVLPKVSRALGDNNTITLELTSPLGRVVSTLPVLSIGSGDIANPTDIDDTDAPKRQALAKEIEHLRTSLAQLVAHNSGFFAVAGKDKETVTQPVIKTEPVANALLGSSASEISNKDITVVSIQNALEQTASVRSAVPLLENSEINSSQNIKEKRVNTQGEGASQEVEEKQKENRSPKPIPIVIPKNQGGDFGIFSTIMNWFRR